MCPIEQILAGKIGFTSGNAGMYAEPPVGIEL